MRYHILLAVICATMLYVTAVSLPVSQSSSVAVDAAAQPFVPEPGAFIEPAQRTETLRTSNGMGMTVESITNFRDTPQSIIVKASSGGKDFFFNVTVSPNATWGYGSINGFMIVPDRDAVVTAMSSYYPGGDELVAVLDGKAKEAYIYVGGRESPSLVITDTDTSWGYSSGFVTVKANNGKFVSKVIMFWPGAGVGTAFIEDTRRKENLAYEIVRLEEHVAQLRNDYAAEQENVASLQQQLDSDKQELEKQRLVKLQAEKVAGELRTSITDGRSMLTASVLLSPVQSAVGIVLVLILIVMAADAFMFKPKKGEGK